MVVSWPIDLWCESPTQRVCICNLTDLGRAPLGSHRRGEVGGFPTHDARDGTRANRYSLVVIGSRRAVMLVGVMTLILSACAGSSGNAPRPGTTPATGSTYDVQVDGVTPAFNATFAAYFPDSLVVHAGDTIVFHSVFRGNPHTVTLGTLVDQGLAASDAAVAAAPAPGGGGAGGYGPAGSVDDHTTSGSRCRRR